MIFAINKYSRAIKRFESHYVGSHICGKKIWYGLLIISLESGKYRINTFKIERCPNYSVSLLLKDLPFKQKIKRFFGL